MHDAIMLAYLLVVEALLLTVGSGPHREPCARRIYVSGAALVIACHASRGSVALPYWARQLGYRAVLAGVLLANYLMLRDVLPAIRPDAVDAQLARLDLLLFHFEPAIWLERFNRPPVVEWFAFFYFSYFFVSGAYLVGVVFLGRDRDAVAEFALGTTIVFCLGQIGYLAVPAVGPARYLVADFHGPVRGEFFWFCVQKTVAAGSAMKDVFPSLHTAVPTWFVWYATQRTKSSRAWKLPREVTFVFAFNIVISTVFLRWHYLVDVVAGLALSAFAGIVTPRLVRLETAWRARVGLGPVWGTVLPSTATANAP